MRLTFCNRSIIQLQTLTTLSLGINQIGNEGVQHLVDGLVANTVSFVLCIFILLNYYFPIKAITTLDLTGNRIGVEGIRYLGHALKSIKAITTLNLYANQIGEDAAMYLAAGLENHPVSSFPDSSLIYY